MKVFVVAADYDYEGMGEPTVLSAQPADRTGPTVTFTYTGLPRRNDSFGVKRLQAGLDVGRCTCTREARIRTFYPFSATNNPEGRDPNWFYYWMQTGVVPPEAARIRVVREEQLPADPGAVSSRTVLGHWDGRSETIVVGDGAARTCATPMTETQIGRAHV